MKKGQRSIRANFVYNIIFEIFKIVVPLITTPYIARILKPEGVGTFSLAQTYALYFAMFASFGFSFYGARELAYVRDDQEKLKNTFWEVFLCKAVFSSIAIVAYLIFVFKIDSHTDLSYKIYTIYLIEILLDASFYFTAIENFKTIAIRNITIKLLTLVFIFLFIRTEDQVWLYTLIVVMSGVLGQFVIIFSLDKFLFNHPKVKLEHIGKHIKGSFALFVPTIAIQVYTLLDKAMLGAICGESETGFYENSQKMIRLASTLSSAIVSVSVPRMAYTFAKGNIEDLRNHFAKVFRFVSFLVFPITFGLIAIASNFSSWYYGQSFFGIDTLVMMGSPLIISLGWSGIMGNMVLISTGNQKYFTRAVYIGAICNVVLNVVLMKPLGAAGALIASLVAEFTGMILMFIYSNTIFNIAFVLKTVPKYIFSAAIMGVIVKIVSLYLPFGILTTMFEIMVGACIYFFVMFLSKDPNVFEIYNTVMRLLNKVLSKKSLKK